MFHLLDKYPSSVPLAIPYMKAIIRKWTDKHTRKRNDGVYISYESAYIYVCCFSDDRHTSKITPNESINMLTCR
jgi:hypothetical protein